MKLEELAISGAFVLESPSFADDRGFFREWFKDPDQRDAGLAFEVRQANLSRSTRNVVRGLHYSLAPEGQAKVVTCVEGELDEVMVDVRVGSPTYGVVVYLSLSADSGRSLYVPAGAAHGFCVTSEFASLAYLLSSIYNPSMEREINPLDSEIAVPWRLSAPAILSPKDAAAPTLAARLRAGELPSYA